ncbi:class I SAM-dependent methyltransferase [Streptomyces sp. TLI_146]|uniref:class I SAM-dependent methyltransferase n=1 Tax=Streptomyces sp. TLI_146 TaxID=1938858 RepID=UPI000C70D72F|nr:class I SAM-dependent methyltransferase [Streptomyces sp. TLI_146]PKV84234.1 methyltransferase family protein [Streptomyces sp. TLI_146]
MSDFSPFLDSRLATGSLYRTQQRLAERTQALLAAKVCGRPAAQVVAAHAAHALPRPGATVVDIGCGRGASTVALAQALPRPRIVAIDASAALLAATRTRLHQHGLTGATVQADFHRLPLHDHTAHLAVAAFCLYHSPRPELVVREIARCLTPGGTVILATKSADSYRSLDHLIVRAGLDPHAEARPSLYAAFNSANLRSTVEGVLQVKTVEHETHRFQFHDLAHTAAYLATSPKYQLPPGLANNAAALTDRLRQALPDGPVTTASVVSYLVAAAPAE